MTMIKTYWGIYYAKVGNRDADRDHADGTGWMWQGGESVSVQLKHEAISECQEKGRT